MRAIARAVARVVALAAATALFSAAPASADIFRVRGVKTEAEGETAAAAQGPALALGQARALEQLTNRLTAPRDRYLLPPVTSQEAETLVAGLEVEEQANTATSYSATITVTFDPAQVRQYFRDRGVQHVESRTRSSLVLPLWRDSEGVRLWANNPWLSTWQARDFSDELTPLATPLGDISDIGGVTANQALSLDSAALGAMARRYRLDRILVVYARQGSGGAMAQVRELDFAQGGKVVDGGRLTASNLGELRDRVFDSLQTEWKQSLTAATGAKNDIVLSVRFGTLAEWLRLETALGGAALLSDVRLEALSNDGAMVRAVHRGAVEQLRLELRERGVALTPEPAAANARETVFRVEALGRASARGDAPPPSPAGAAPAGAASGATTGGAGRPDAAIPRPPGRSGPG